MNPQRTPLTLLTGFLGSGKTTLLRELLAQPAMADTAVIINEFGEVGLDHLLLEHVSENLRVMSSGCLCCSLRGDLADTLADLLRRRDAGQIAFGRVVVETTGLADPVPVLHTLVADTALAARIELAGVITTVDGVNGDATLQRHEEARRQAAMADTLLLTKSDLAPDAALAALEQRLVAMNPAATLHRVIEGRIDAALLLRHEHDPLLAFQRVEAALRETALREARSPHADREAHHHGGHGHGHGHGHDHDHDHDDDDASIRSHCLTIEHPVSGAALQHWLELLAAMRGERLLRFKALACVQEHPEQPLVLHAAQHIVHPPARLACWPSADRRSRLVFITQGLARDELQRTLARFAGASAVPAKPPLPEATRSPA